jgi:poly(3-hydroxybutyrate) depolymerase
MSLTSNLSHAGTVVGLVGSGSVLALALVHAGTHGPKQTVQSPLNMLAKILDAAPNSKSGYPPMVVALISVPGPDGGMYVSQLPTLWRQLDRLQKDKHSKKGSSVESVTSYSDEGVQLTTDELSNREAMLLDLNASLLSLRSRLGSLLDQERGH